MIDNIMDIDDLFATRQLNGKVITTHMAYVHSTHLEVKIERERISIEIVFCVVSISAPFNSNSCLPIALRTTLIEPHFVGEAIRQAKVGTKEKLFQILVGNFSRFTLYHSPICSAIEERRHLCGSCPSERLLFSHFD